MGLLASVCLEVVDYWNDLAVYFGTHRPGVTSELRPIHLWRVRSSKIH